MDEKDLGELRDLVEFLKENGIAQFEMERADLKVKLKFAGAAAADAGLTVGNVDLGHLAQLMHATGGGAGTQAPPLATPGAPAAAATAAVELTPAEPALHMVKSPLVGTFYPAPSPGSEPFVKVGDRVVSGQVLCIVEAMKLMNEVEADAAGEIAAVYPASGQPIEYGQALFAIR